MNCSEVQEHLSSYYDGQLSHELRTVVAAHLEDCEACAEELVTFQEISSLSAQLDDPQPPLSLWSRLETELDQAGPTVVVAPRMVLRQFPARLAAVAAVLLVAVGIGFLTLQGWPKPSHHELAADMDRYLEQFLSDPDKAQQVFLARHRSETVDLHEPAQLAGYQRILASQLPDGYSLDTLHVFDMALCSCGETPCVCDNESCSCSQAIYKRDNGEMLVVFQHAVDQPQWFHNRPTTHRRCHGKPTRLVQLDDTRLAATWSMDGTFLTLVGAQDIEEVTQFVAHLGG